MELRKKLINSILATLLLMGCSATPEKKIIINEVKIPVAVCPKPDIQLLAQSPTSFFSDLPYRNIATEPSIQDIVESYVLSIELLEHKVVLLYEQLSIYQYYNEEMK